MKVTYVLSDNSNKIHLAQVIIPLAPDESEILDGQDKAIKALLGSGKVSLAPYDELRLVGVLDGLVKWVEPRTGKRGRGGRVG